MIAGLIARARGESAQIVKKVTVSNQQWEEKRVALVGAEDEANTLK